MVADSAFGLHDADKDRKLVWQEFVAWKGKGKKGGRPPRDEL